MHAGEVLVLTGPPGSGKTTTAQALAAHPGVPKVHLHADDFWHFIGYGAIAPYLPEAHRQNGIVIDVLAAAAERYARGNYFVIVDGILGPWFLQPFRAMAMPVHYIVLRPQLEVALQRCRDRGGDTLTDPGHITALHEQLSSLGDLERHVLRTEGQGPAQTTSEVAKALLSGAFRLPS